MSESRLVLVLLFTGRKIGANFLCQSCSVANAKPITFRHSNENRSNDLLYRLWLSSSFKRTLRGRFFQKIQDWILTVPAVNAIMQGLKSIRYQGAGYGTTKRVQANKYTWSTDAPRSILICFQIYLVNFLYILVTAVMHNRAFLTLFLVIQFVSYLHCNCTCKVAFYVAKTELAT